MGSPKTEVGRFSWETQRRVCVEPMFVGKYEVTFEEYDVFAKATGRPLPKDQGWGRGRRPVINVSWNDAVAYATWLSESTGADYRLPTEAEWEYATRAGTSTPYWTGDCVNTEQVNYDGNLPYEKCAKGEYRRKTVSAGSLPANPWGLHEVHGNVWEWVQDEVSGLRVIRGGSWVSVARYVRSAIRNWDPPQGRIESLGFRLART